MGNHPSDNDFAQNRRLRGINKQISQWQQISARRATGLRRNVLPVHVICPDDRFDTKKGRPSAALSQDR
jgi:hypothetical protein